MKAIAAICGALILAVIVARRMWEQPIWYGDGWMHFHVYAAVYAVFSGALIAFRPRWFPALLGAVVLLVTVGAAGVVPVAAAAYILASCFALGRLIRPQLRMPEAILLGLACCMLTVQVLVHFPVNYPLVYGSLLAIPLLFNWQVIKQYTLPPGEGSAAQAFGLFPLLCHWLVVLKPETGPDALSMHLANPMSIAFRHQGSFDVRHMIRAAMPMGGDWVYLLGVLLGGEFAARLLNLAMLAIIATLIFRASLRWVGRTQAWLLVALFASLPVVQMVTGSLFVENIWAVFLLAAYLSVDDALLCGIFAGAAVMTKLLAAAFALPILFSKRPKIAALALAGLWALPPYIEAYVRTGNPVFPYMNTIFKSPFYDTQTPFVDDRLNEKLNPAVLYRLTFDTHKYVEGQDGAFGFQMLLLLPLVLLAAVKRPFQEWRTLAVVLVSSLLILSAAPHMRYLYPAMAISSILFALLLAELGNTGTLLVVACTAANLCFLPAASWIHKDFAWNPFDQAAADRFLTAGAPTRKLIAYMNEQHPGQPVLFLETLEVAGLHATEFSNSWHHTSFLKQLGNADYPAGLTNLFAANNIRYFIAPLHIPVRQIAVAQHLQANAAKELENGNYAVYALHDGPPQAVSLQTMPEGSYDDADPAIVYSGGWERDIQFVEARGHTLSYTNLPGARARFRFFGHELTYVFTKAPNRGRAEVAIDGVSRGELVMNSAKVEWQSQTTFKGLGDGWHEIEIRVVQGYADIDALVAK